MAHRFTVIFEKEAEGGYHVFCPTLPGCHTQSETIEEGVENIREAIGLYVESLVDAGLPIPAEDIFIKPIEIPAWRRQTGNWKAETRNRRTAMLLAAAANNSGYLESSLRAVAGALEHSKVDAPRTHGLAVLVGHDPGDLVQMSQVMSRPGRQQL